MEGIDGLERVAAIVEQLDIQTQHNITRGAVLTIRRNRLNARLRRINGTERVLDRVPRSAPQRRTVGSRKLVIRVLQINSACGPTIRGSKQEAASIDLIGRDRGTNGLAMLVTSPSLRRRVGVVGPAYTAGRHVGQTQRLNRRKRRARVSTEEALNVGNVARAPRVVATEPEEPVISALWLSSARVRRTKRLTQRLVAFREDRDALRQFVRRRDRRGVARVVARVRVVHHASRRARDLACVHGDARVIHYRAVRALVHNVCDIPDVQVGTAYRGNSTARRRSEPDVSRTPLMMGQVHAILHIASARGGALAVVALDGQALSIPERIAGDRSDGGYHTIYQN